MKNVIFIGNFIVPDGSAAGLRVWNIGKVFKVLGYTPIFISFSKKGSVFNYQKDEINEFEIYSSKYPSSNIDWFRVLKRFSLICKLLNSIVISRETIIYLYGSQSTSILNLLIFIKFKRKVNKIIYDAVDHLIYNTRNFLFDFYKNIDTFIQNNIINFLFSDLIVISEFFYIKYNNFNRNLIIIPPIFESTKKISHPIISSNKIFIGYIGFPFRTHKVITSSKQVKDRLDLIIKSFIDHLKINKKSRLQLNIYGLDIKTFLHAYPHFIEIKNFPNIQFFGVLENSIIRDIYNSLDFTILLRDRNTTSLAGFPSKVAESVSFATPVIVNNFGDITKYIKNNVNGFVSLAGSNDNLTTIFDNISKITSSELSTLKNNTLETNPFSLQNYISLLERFIIK